MTTIVNTAYPSVFADFIKKAAEDFGGGAVMVFQNESDLVITHSIGGEEIHVGKGGSVFQITLPEEFAGDGLRFWGAVRKLKMDSENSNRPEF